MGKKIWSTMIVMIIVAACGGPTGSPTPGASATAAPPPAVPSVPTGYTELDKALTSVADSTGKQVPTYKGKKVNIQTQWIGQEGIDFAAAVKDFATATGITIQIDSIGSSHETVLKTRIDGGTPPDLAMLAQPTPVLAYAAAGKVTDVSTFMDATKLNAEFPSTIGLVSKDGHIWGIPYKADVKSVIWYPIKAFAAKGYTVPKTWDELITLSNKIVTDGSNPWCVSAGGPGDATGWQITDWVEEVVLKTKGLDYYNKWISHEVTFQDQGIKDAFAKVGQIFFTDKYVYGGATAIVPTDQKTPMDPMFKDDMVNPGCWMQKIPTWYGPGFFPDQRASGQPSKYIIGTDVGIFPFPTIDPAQNNVEGSADTLMVTVPPNGAALRDEVKAVAEFLATPAGVQNYIRNGNAISANASTPKDWYVGHIKLQIAADIVNAASGIGFDASDLMPAKVGSGTFWTQSDAWANANGSNLDAVLKAIDDSWPPPAQ
jgi:alpha-glucoside transport system substrate-binding protein